MLPQEGRGTKEPPRLLVDAMLGTLARWLRLMGYDAEYWGAGTDEALAERARQEGRLLITRDRQLAGRRGVNALLVHAEALDHQIAEVRTALRELGDLPVAARCGECNGELEPLPREEARALVPPYVWNTQPAFQRCLRCHRVYWRGTHWPGLRARIDEAP